MAAYPGLHVVAADHPSLDRDIDAFIERLQCEQRRFGPTARANPKPSRSLCDDLRGRGGFRLAAVECGQIVALARIDGGGRLKIAVGPEHRGRGIGTVLGRAMAERARNLRYPRVVLWSARRSRAARRIGEDLGAVVVEHGRGRTELILDLLPIDRTA